MRDVVLSPVAGLSPGVDGAVLPETAPETNPLRHSGVPVRKVEGEPSAVENCREAGFAAVFIAASGVGFDAVEHDPLDNDGVAGSIMIGTSVARCLH